MDMHQTFTFQITKFKINEKKIECGISTWQTLINYELNEPGICKNAYLFQLVSMRFRLNNSRMNVISVIWLLILNELVSVTFDRCDKLKSVQHGIK